MSIKQTLLRALDRYRGDDLERAEQAFRNMSAAELQQEHGHSGKTRAQIVDEYRADRREVEAAERWVEVNVPESIEK